MILLSFVIPLYNNELTVVDTIKSIFNSGVDSKIYELIFVDDESPDDSSTIVEETMKAADFYNYKIIRKVNGGLSSARNFGLVESRGEFVWFVDADDLINSDKLKQLVEELYRERNCIDFMTISVQPYINTSELDHEVDGLKFEKITGPELSKRYLSNSRPSYAVQNIWKRHYLLENNFRFPLGLNFEDLATSYLWSYDAKTGLIDVSNTWMYGYRQIDGSITHTVTSKSLLDRLEVLKKMTNILKNQDRLIEANRLRSHIISYVMYDALRYKPQLLTTIRKVKQDLEIKILGTDLLVYYLTRFQIIRNLLEKGRK